MFQSRRLFHWVNIFKGSVGLPVITADIKGIFLLKFLSTMVYTNLRQNIPSLANDGGDLSIAYIRKINCKYIEAANNLQKAFALAYVKSVLGKKSASKSSDKINFKN